MKKFFVCVLMLILCSLSFGAWKNDYLVNSFGDRSEKIAVCSDETKTFFVIVQSIGVTRFQVQLDDVYMGPYIQVKFDDGEILKLENFLHDRVSRNFTNVVFVHDINLIKKIKNSKTMKVAVTLNGKDYVVLIDNTNSKNAIDKLNYKD